MYAYDHPPRAGSIGYTTEAVKCIIAARRAAVFKLANPPPTTIEYRSLAALGRGGGYEAWTTHTHTHTQSIIDDGGR